MARLDLRKDWAPLYTARKKPDVIEVPARRAIAITETLPPGADTMAPIFATIYPVAYTLKFATKAQGVLDYPVLPPEATFRISDFAKHKDWRWTVAIAVPDVIDAAALRRAVTAVREHHPETPLLNRVKLAVLPAGTQARILHVGEYDAEQPTIDRLVAFVREAGYRPGSRHIEVYLSDPARVPEERMRTVIRMSVTRR